MVTMDVVRPRTLDEALRLKADLPTPRAGSSRVAPT